MELSQEQLDRIRDLDNFEPVVNIVVIGVGGAGNNAVNRMVDEQIRNVTFWVANTDKKALSTSKCSNRIILGDETARGQGAGADPEIGRKAAEFSAEEIRSVVTGADLVFIAAGMGKGTGTGASPVIAKIAKEVGALTVAIVTRPFQFEGKQRTTNASKGLNDLSEVVDSIMVVSNDKMLKSVGTLDSAEAFAEADKILAQSVKTVADIILTPGTMNLDFADVKATLENAGSTLIGFGVGTGPNKTEEAVENAINLNLLETSIVGAKKGICNVVCGNGVTLYEATNCMAKVSELAGTQMDIKFGYTKNTMIDDTIFCSIIAAGFDDIDISKNPIENQTPIVQMAAPQPAKESAPSMDTESVLDFLMPKI